MAVQNGLSEIGIKLGERVYWNNVEVASKVDDVEFEVGGNKDRIIETGGYARFSGEQFDLAFGTYSLFRRRALPHQFGIEYALRTFEPVHNAETVSDEWIEQGNFYYETILLNLNLTQLQEERKDFGAEFRFSPLLIKFVQAPKYKLLAQYLGHKTEREFPEVIKYRGALTDLETAFNGKKIAQEKLVEAMINFLENYGD